MLAGGEEMNRPNGVISDVLGTWVVAYGGSTLFRIREGEIVDQSQLPAGGLDGLVYLGEDDFLVSSWEGQAVYRGAGDTWEAAVENVEAPADIGWDASRGRVLIPLFQANVLHIEPIS